MSNRPATAVKAPSIARTSTEHAQGTGAHGVDDADDVVTAVLTATRLLVSVSARSLAAVEETLTLPQFRMLMVLGCRGEMNISRLGNQLDVIPSTAMRMVDRLATAQMLLRVESATNRREILIALTDTGRSVVRRATERRRVEIARLVHTMPLRYRRDLITALQAFTEAAREPRTDRRPVTGAGW